MLPYCESAFLSTNDFPIKNGTMKRGVGSSDLAMAGGMHGPAWVPCHSKIHAIPSGALSHPSICLPPPLFIYISPHLYWARLHDCRTISSTPTTPIYHLVRSRSLPASSLDPRSKEARHPPLCLKGSQAPRSSGQGGKGYFGPHSGAIPL